MVINQSARMFTTPVLLLHVTLPATTLCPHPEEVTTGQDPLSLLCQRPVSPQLCVLPAPRRVAPPRTAQDNHSEFQDKLAETPS